MNVWVWQRVEDNPNEFCFSRTEPTRAKEDNPLARIKEGQLLANAGCPVAVMPADIRQHLPSHGTAVQLEFHDLWGKAKDLPGYDKRVWTNLQMMLGD